jgi:hypothetical protein
MMVRSAYCLSLFKLRLEGVVVMMMMTEAVV